MSIFSRLRSWGRQKSNTSNPAQWFVDWVRGGEGSASGISVTSESALHEAICLACVSIRSADLAKLPLHVYRTRPDGGREIVRGHAVERVLRKPNEWQNQLEFIEQLQAQVLMKGNGYAGIVRNGRGEPTELIPIPNVSIETSPDGSLFYRWNSANQFELAILSAKFRNPIPADDVLHLRWMTLNGLMGLGRVNLARDAIGLSLALERHSSRLFANGARPGGVLQTDKRLSDDVFKRFKVQWSEYTGVDNAGKTPILEEGLKWISQAMTSVEAETIAARRFQIEQIATFFDVPLHRLGVIPEGGATAIMQAHQMYLNNTLSTDAERWEAKFEDKFGISGDLSVEFDLDYFNRADIQTRMTAYRTGVMGMTFTPNEVRRKEGLADKPGGDVIYQQGNVFPLGTVTPGNPGPGSDVTGAPAPGGDGDPTAPPAIPTE